MPVAGGSLLGYVVSPIDPTTVYACTNDPNSTTQHMVLWRTREAGQHWSRLALPASAGNSCSISISAVQPQRIVYMTYAAGDEPACESATLYLSTDGGSTWKHIVHNSSAPDTRMSVFCTITVTSHDLYFLSSYGGEMNTPQQSILERSTNDGDSWEGIDSAFGSGSLFLSPQVGADDTTLAISVWSHVSGLDHEGANLWMSHDAGSTWQWIGPVPGGTFLLTSHQHGNAWPSSASPFYLLINEQLPEALYAERVAQSNDGRRWTALPPLPVPGTSATHLGISQVLDVTNDGRLLAFGADPKTGLAAQGQADQNAPPTPAFWLWMWNPRLTRWQVFPNPLAHPVHIGCGLCWDTSLSVGAAHTTYLYIYNQDTLYPTSQSFFSIRLPAM
jgi:hypothetical protein